MLNELYLTPTLCEKDISIHALFAKLYDSLVSGEDMKEASLYKDKEAYNIFHFLKYTYNYLNVQYSFRALNL